MKAYKDYMDSFSPDEKWQNDTIKKLQGMSTGSKKSFAHKGLRMAAMIAVMCLALGITAYAVINVVWAPAEEADTGGSWVMVPVEEDYYEREGMLIGTGIYVKGFDLSQNVLDEETAQALRELLEGKVFTEDGEPFDLFVHAPGGYIADDRGYALYGADGVEIGSIYYDSIIRSKPISIDISTAAQVEELYAFPYSYEDAAKFLGQDFRLPAVYTESLSPPGFKMQDESYRGRYAVYVSLGGEPGMYFFVERNRSGEPDEWAAPGAAITEALIADTAVYKISDDIAGNRYTWENDGLTYMFFQSTGSPACFTDEQCEDIIRSMIE